MDGADGYAVPANPWSLVRGYFSPATLFLLLNVVIGTIALTSRSHRRDDEYQYYARPPPPAPIARTSSMIERLRSIGLYRFRSGDFPPEYNHHRSATMADGASDASSAHHAHRYARSRSEPAERPPAPVLKTDNKVEPVTRAVKKSTSEVKKMERAPTQPRRVQLQRVPPRAPAARAVSPRVVEEDAAAASVDALADDFINRFRQQLHLQRLNSLLNYKEMLNRGL